MIRSNIKRAIIFAPLGACFGLAISMIVGVILYPSEVGLPSTELLTGVLSILGWAMIHYIFGLVLIVIFGLPIALLVEAKCGLKLHYCVAYGIIFSLLFASIIWGIGFGGITQSDQIIPGEALTLLSILLAGPTSGFIFWTQARKAT